MREQCNRRKKMIGLSVLAALVFGMLCAGLTQAATWLSERQEIQASVAVSDFEVAGIAFFSQGTQEEDLKKLEALNATDSDTLNGLQNVNLMDPSADRYIGKLRFGIKYKGVSPAYVRVRVLEQWIDSENEEVLSEPFTPYETASGWIDHRMQDYCYYSEGTYPQGLAVTKSGVIDSSAMREMSQLLICGVKTGQMKNLDGSARLKLVFEVEAVQPNRYRELFQIDQYPDGSG